MSMDRILHPEFYLDAEDEEDPELALEVQRQLDAARKGVDIAAPSSAAEDYTSATPAYEVPPVEPILTGVRIGQKKWQPKWEDFWEDGQPFTAPGNSTTGVKLLKNLHEQAMGQAKKEKLRLKAAEEDRADWLESDEEAVEQPQAGMDSEEEELTIEDIKLQPQEIQEAQLNPLVVINKLLPPSSDSADLNPDVAPGLVSATSMPAPHLPNTFMHLSLTAVQFDMFNPKSTTFMIQLFYLPNRLNIRILLPYSRLMQLLDDKNQRFIDNIQRAWSERGWHCPESQLDVRPSVVVDAATRARYFKLDSDAKDVWREKPAIKGLKLPKKVCHVQGRVVEGLGPIVTKVFQKSSKRKKTVANYEVEILFCRTGKVWKKEIPPASLREALHLATGLQRLRPFHDRLEDGAFRPKGVLKKGEIKRIALSFQPTARKKATLFPSNKRGTVLNVHGR